MEHAQLLEFVKLWRKAQSVLQGDVHIPREQYTLVMQVTFLPSRPPHPPAAYAFLASRNPANLSYVLACSRWDSETDMKKFESPTVRLCDSQALEPTISRREVPVDVERARKLQTSIEALVISPMP